MTTTRDLAEERRVTLKQEVEALRACDRPNAVYTLSDPMNGIVRYVGVTKQVPRVRLIAHVADARAAKKLNRRIRWVRWLLAHGRRPQMEVIARFKTIEEASAYEIAMIATYRALGAPLTNGTDGGEHVGIEGSLKVSSKNRGRKHSEQTRARMSAAQMGNQNGAGYKHTEEAKERMRAQRAGRRLSAEHRDKIRAASLRQPKFSDERLAKMRAASTGNKNCVGRKLSEETKKKIGAAQARHHAALREAKR